MRGREAACDSQIRAKPARAAAVRWGAGPLLGGLVSLRPDHDRYVHATRDAMEAGRGTVVVHALSVAQRQAASEFLAARGGDVTRTL